VQRSAGKTRKLNDDSVEELLSDYRMSGSMTTSYVVTSCSVPQRNVIVCNALTI
jgi:hypothetical protein